MTFVTANTRLRLNRMGTVALNGKMLVLNQSSIPTGTQLTVWLGFDAFFYAAKTVD